MGSCPCRGTPCALQLLLLLVSDLSRDGKTGVLTDRAWRERARNALRQGEHTHGLLVLDLDHFKVINDMYGHRAGDQVLAAIAHTISTVVRAHDIVGRLGGEEFVVLVTDLGSDLATDTMLAAVAERIRRHVADLNVEVTTLDGPTAVTGLTVSIGGARYPEHGPDLDTLLLVADAECYRAKAAGRDTVCRGHSTAANLRRRVMRVTSTGSDPSDDRPRRHRLPMSNKACIGFSDPWQAKRHARSSGARRVVRSCAPRRIGGCQPACSLVPSLAVRTDRHTVPSQGSASSTDPRPSPDTARGRHGGRACRGGSPPSRVRLSVAARSSSAHARSARPSAAWQCARLLRIVTVTRGSSYISSPSAS